MYKGIIDEIQANRDSRPHLHPLHLFLATGGRITDALIRQVFLRLPFQLLILLRRISATMGNAESRPDDDASSPVKDGDKQTGSPLAVATSSTDENEKRDASNTPHARPSRRSDDQVNVNMPMADLMAYLQVVANNSNNLPLTIRDDPELDRAVTGLSSEDYARKSAAFVPADVRVIGGTFTRYGRVWDLPTSEVRLV